MTLARKLLGAAALAVGVFAAQSESSTSGVTLHLFPTADTTTLRPIQWDEATSIISHALGVSHLSPALQFADHHAEVLNDESVRKVSSGVLEQTRPNLFIVARGLDADEVPVPAKFTIGQASETSSSLISNMAYDFAELSAARFDDELATLYVTSEERDNPVSNCAVVKLGASDAAISASKAPVSLRTTLTEIADTAYVDVKSHLVEKFGSTAKVFDEKVARDKSFMVEVKYISSLFEALRIQSLHPTDAKSAFRSIIINLSQLDILAEEYGTSSEKYIKGAAITRQVLDEAIKSFTTTHKPSAVEILSVPPTISATGGTSPRPLLRRRATTSTATSTTCPKSHDECVSVFNNCSRHGECAPTRVPSLNDVCFFCNCNGTQWTDDDGNPEDGYAPVKWTGNSCQYQDVTMGFHIIFWLVVVLAIVLLYVISLLASIGNGDGGSGAGCAGKRSKAD